MENIPIRKFNTAPSGPVPSESFSIRNLTDLLAGKDLFEPLHRHDFFFILALDQAAGEHAIDFVPYPVGNHSVFFIRPGQVHQLSLKAGSTGYLMQFNHTFYYPHDKASNQLLCKVSQKNFCPLSPDSFKKLFSILTYIFQEYSDKQEGYQEVIKASLRIFCIELMRQGQHFHSTSYTDKLYTQERLEEFLELLETHITAHKQVSDYAHMLNLSPYQLNSITKTSLGKTCSEIINEYIVLETKRHLLATPNQVKEIAYHLGYEDVSYFIRFFKKQTGYSPDAFRQTFQ